MINMRDVAKMAGVSIGTVSNYINGTKSVRFETRQKIEHAIEILNYHPNTIARSLKRSISNEIGIILPSINDSYYSSVFKGIEKVFGTDGNFINLAFSDDIEDKERQIISSFLEKRVNGIIVATCQPQNHDFFKANIEESHLPIVFIDRKPPILNVNFVGVDTKSSIFQMTLKLLDKGYRRIVLVTGPDSFSSENDCWVGYCNAFRLRGIEICKELHLAIRPFKEASFDACIRLLATTHVDAIITSSSLLLEGALEALYLRHLKPQIDVPILSLGEDVWNMHTARPDVFISKRPAIDVGESAALLLQQNIASPVLFETKSVELADNFNIELLQVPCKTQNSHIEIAESPALRILMESAHGTASAIGSLMRDFEATNHCRIIIDTRPMEDMFDAIVSNSKTESNLYDVIMYDIPWLPSFADEGFLADITEYIKNEWRPENYFSPRLPEIYGKFNEKYYGIPFTYSPPILFYRSDLFSDFKLRKEYYNRYQIRMRPPKTWTEYNALAEFFNEVGKRDTRFEYGICLYGQSKEHLIPHFLPRLAAFGGGIFNDRLQITINSPACRKALLSLKKTAELSSMPFNNSTLVTATKEFYDGKTALLFGHGSYATAFSKDISSPVAGKVGYAPLPGNSPHIAGWGLGISASSSQRTLSLRFFDWLGRSDISTYSTILEGQSLLFGSHSNSELQKVYPWLSLEFDSLTDITLRSGAFLNGGKVVPRNRIEECIYSNICAYLTNLYSLEETITSMEHGLKKLFRDYGYSGF